MLGVSAPNPCVVQVQLSMQEERGPIHAPLLLLGKNWGWSSLLSLLHVPSIFYTNDTSFYSK